MCGIFGYKGNPSPKIVEKIASLASERGFHSFGYSLYAQSTLSSERHQGTLKIEKIPVEQDAILIGHCRLATTGTRELRDSAPFEDGYISVVHNGEIQNKEELSHELNSGYRTDSMLLLPIIRRGLNIADKIEGNYAIAYIEERELKLENRGLPLFVMEDENCLYFCSQEFNLE